MTKFTDQVWHVAVAVAFVAAASLGGALAGALLGLCIALLAESKEAGGSRIEVSELIPHFRKPDTLLDMTVYVFAGAVAGWALI